MKPTFTKKQVERIHAQKRLAERYGITLTGKAF